MESEDDEVSRVRSVALQNANAILLVRQRAERDLLEAKAALERKTEELAHSLAMMKATLESTTDGILVTNANREVTGFNQKFVEMWTLPAELMARRDHRQILALSSSRMVDPVGFRARVDQIYEASPAETYDILELANGRQIERFSKPQRIGERNVGRVWTFRDITDQRRADRELREQSEWFRVTLGSIGDAVITVDTQGRITFLNPVAEKLSGWSSAEAVGQSLDQVMRLVMADSGETAENPIHGALAEGTVILLANHTILIRRDGSEIPIEDSAAPIKDSTEVMIGAVMVFHDVTERRQKEMALAESYQAAQEARSAAEQANLAKDHFIAALSHELRTPLTPVLAILSSIRQDSEVPATLAEDLETIRRNVELEARLIDDLLDLTRIARGKLHLHAAPASVGQIIEDAINTCLSDLEAKHLVLHTELAIPHPTLNVDSARVTQVLWNLLKNSIKFTPTKGTISLSSRVDAEEGACTVTIEVRDTGIGMEPEEVKRLFQAFEQGDRSITRQFGGLGLGLAISKAIAEAHRGKLEGFSAGKGKGSTFTLTLPCAAGGELPESESITRPAAAEQQQIRPSNAAQRPLRILLVEDHADTAAILTRLLGRMGHEVLHADRIAQSVELAEREMHGGGIDLVISDLGLPDGTGCELMRTLSGKYAIKGIALSGYGMDSDREQSLAAGFSRHLVKPIDVAVLRQAITELMGG